MIKKYIFIYFFLFIRNNNLLSHSFLISTNLNCSDDNNLINLKLINTKDYFYLKTLDNINILNFKFTSDKIIFLTKNIKLLHLNLYDKKFIITSRKGIKIYLYELLKEILPNREIIIINDLDDSNNKRISTLYPIISLNNFIEISRVIFYRDIIYYIYKKIGILIEKKNKKIKQNFIKFDKKWRCLYTNF